MYLREGGAEGVDPAREVGSTLGRGFCISSVR